MSLQILFVLFAGILLPDQTVSKPYQIFAEEEHQLSHEVNETSDTRSKRQVLLGLRPSAQECILVHHKQGRQILV